MFAIILEIRENVVTLWSPKKAMGSFQSGQMGQTVNLLSFDFGGSNPSLPTNNTAEVAQLIEHQPSKLRVASLSLVFRSKISFTDCDDGHSRFFCALWLG